VCVCVCVCVRARARSCERKERAGEDRTTATRVGVHSPLAVSRNLVARGKLQIMTRAIGTFSIIFPVIELTFRYGSLKINK